MIKFGVAGNSVSFIEEGFNETFDAAVWCKNRGIDAFEYSFGNGIRINAGTAKKIGDEFLRNGIEMSAHAPYYINFANPDPLLAEKSYQYVLSSAKKLIELSGERLVVHVAAQGAETREAAVALTKSRLYTLAGKIEEAGFTGLKICLETMGKIGQIGTVDEIVNFCTLAPFFYPCIDFGHINAREQGILKSSTDYKVIIEKMLSVLPPEKVKFMHVHFSKIQYGQKGEIRHLTFRDDLFGPNFEDLAPVIIEYGLEPFIICESSGTQAEDAVYMKNYYNSLVF